MNIILNYNLLAKKISFPLIKKGFFIRRAKKLNTNFN